MDIFVKFFVSEDLHDLDELIKVVRPLEEGFYSVDHTSHGATKGPYVQTVMIISVVHQQFWALVVSRCHSDIVILIFDIEFGESPIDHSQVLVLVINDNIERLEVSMHDTMGMTKLKSLENLEHVDSALEISESGKEVFAVLALHPLVNKAWNSRNTFFDQVSQLYDVWPSVHCLQDFDFSVDFFALDGFKHLDDTLTVVGFAETKEHFRVFTSSQLLPAFVVVDGAPRYVHC